MKTACVILAAGAGTRMKSRYPKVLHPVSGLPMIEHVLRVAEGLKADPIVVVAGHCLEALKSFVGSRAQMVEQKDLKGTGDALLRTGELLRSHGGSVLVLSGDAPLLKARTAKRLIRERESTGSKAVFLTAKLDDAGQYGRVIRSREGKVEKIQEVASASEEELKVSEINVGAYAFDASAVFEALQGLVPDPLKNEYYLTDVIEVMARVSEVRTVTLNQALESLGVNSRRDLAQAEKFMNDKILNKLMDQGVTIQDPATTRIGSDVRVGQDTVIYANTVIEGTAQIGEDCRIGPFARIRDNVKVGDGVTIGNFVEIVRSIIGNKVTIKHLSYIGDSEVESGANIGAGTITANYDGVKKHKTFIGQNARVGSGTVLVAPIRVGKNAVTGAGSVLTKGQDVPEGQTVVGVPAKVLRAKSGKRS